MKTLSTIVSERGQAQIPADIRRRLGIASGTRIVWTLTDDGACTVAPAQEAVVKGAKAMLGFASTFRKTRRTSDWMAELREGENP